VAKTHRLNTADALLKAYAGNARMIHDAHTRGQIVLQARLLGHSITQKTMIGMWEFSKRAKE
jgi:hypothetical protein